MFCTSYTPWWVIVLVLVILLIIFPFFFKGGKYVRGKNGTYAVHNFYLPIGILIIIGLVCLCTYFRIEGGKGIRKYFSQPHYNQKMETIKVLGSSPDDAKMVQGWNTLLPGKKYYYIRTSAGWRGYCKVGRNEQDTLFIHSFANPAVGWGAVLHPNTPATIIDAYDDGSSGQFYVTVNKKTEVNVESILEINEIPKK